MINLTWTSGNRALCWSLTWQGAYEYECLGLYRSPKEQNGAAAIWAHHLQSKVLRCVALPIK